MAQWYRPAGHGDSQFRLSDDDLKPDEHGNLKIHPVYAVVNEIPGGWGWYLANEKGMLNVSGTQATLERAQWDAEQAHAERLNK